MPKEKERMDIECVHVCACTGVLVEERNTMTISHDFFFKYFFIWSFQIAGMIYLYFKEVY